MPNLKPGHFSSRYWPADYYPYDYPYWPGFILGIKHIIAEGDLLKKERLNVLHVSRIEFEFLVESNFIYVSNSPTIKEKLKQDIVEVDSFEKADLIVIDEDLWLIEGGK